MAKFGNTKKKAEPVKVADLVVPKSILITQAFMSQKLNKHINRGIYKIRSDEEYKTLMAEMKERNITQ